MTDNENVEETTADPTAETSVGTGAGEVSDKTAKADVEAEAETKVAAAEPSATETEAKTDAVAAPQDETDASVAPESETEKVKRTPFEVQFSRRHPKVNLAEINNAIRLFEAGTPVPTIMQDHRSEVASLKETDVYNAIDEKELIDQVERHKEHLIREIEAQGKLTEELKSKILSTNNINVLEDIYLPYKLKGRTIATAAKEAGLEELANWTWEQGQSESPEATTFAEKAKDFVKEDSSYADLESVQTGVQNIIAERIAETAELRAIVRQSILRKSKLKCGKGPKAKDKSKYQRFFEYKEPIGSLKKASGAQRYLTIRKGAAANELILSFDRADEGVITEKFENFACPKEDNPHRELLTKAARLALNSQVYTAIEHEAHKMLKDFSEQSILSYLTEGLRKRLLSAPFGNKTVVGIDPGLEKKPSSVVLLSEKGDLLANSNFPVNDEKDWEKFRTEFAQTIEKVNVEAIAIAHGPKGKAVRREIQKVMQEKNLSSPVIMIYEQATTIYSTSSVAKEELPELDPSTRRAVFVGRFLQDPLREMVKVDPKFLATGAFQFDINAARFGKVLHRTIQSAVCSVGVNLNTASRSILAYLPGFDHATAKAVVKHRETKGAFSRFVDVTAVPDVKRENLELSKPFLSFEDTQGDSRGDFKLYEYQNEFTDLESVELDKEVSGVITNITNFGVFIDVGLDQDGLVHISEFTDSTELYGSLAIGDQVKAWISGVEKTKKQLSLSFKSPEERKKRARPRRPQGRGAGGPRKPRGPRRDARSQGPRDESAVNKEGGEGKTDDKPREFRGKGRGKGPRDGKGKSDKPQKKRPPQRDPKTGAIMKMDDSVYVSERKPRSGKNTRSKFKTKAEVTTFNPFANLDKMVKKDSGNGDSKQD